MNSTIKIVAPTPPLLNNQMPRPAIIVEEMKEEDGQQRDWYLGQEGAKQSSVKINKDALGFGTQDMGLRSGAIRNPSNNIFHTILERPSNNHLGSPKREQSTMNV